MIVAMYTTIIVYNKLFQLQELEQELIEERRRMEQEEEEEQSGWNRVEIDETPVNLVVSVIKCLFEWW